ncbi:unnamed protein product [Vitrella brassicaformis CCMP3155]|uniref:AMP-dependent synthetase/ligase domain-containing protein n=2 Tax=Vitrella brassicaformis TaxID=1169539 RepID=A0A0G4FPQ6_VITBC|nr:unnamed protein product [Vitrella brassicaformis CCMP3155]|mmetsp:Transcript_34176/g.84593  ORF Transcript_34176/g.84593 Transcript_34176/m.84593 type:complete len:1180 (+) Transcript_34176:117-3656(+)|eukprot:CEM16409.1 unnamed protein product [Vitrella brassicaformis CCMP3155]
MASLVREESLGREDGLLDTPGEPLSPIPEKMCLPLDENHPWKIWEAVQVWGSNHGDRVALRWYDHLGSLAVSMTYGQLTHEVKKLGWFLQHVVKLQRGDKVALCYMPSLDFIVAFLACLSRGLVAVPLLPVPPDAREHQEAAKELLATIKRAGCRTVLTHTPYFNVLQNSPSSELRPSASNSLRWVDTHKGASLFLPDILLDNDVDEPEVRPQDDACILFPPFADDRGATLTHLTLHESIKSYGRTVMLSYDREKDKMGRDLKETIGGRDRAPIREFPVWPSDPDIDIAIDEDAEVEVSKIQRMLTSFPKNFPDDLRTQYVWRHFISQQTLSHPSRAFSWLPMHYGRGLIYFILTTLFFGFEVLLTSPNCFFVDPWRFLSIAADMECVILPLPTIAIRQLLQLLEDLGNYLHEGEDIPKLEFVSEGGLMCGEDAVDIELVAKFLHLINSDRPRRLHVPFSAVLPVYEASDSGAILSGARRHRKEEALVVTVDVDELERSGKVKVLHEEKLSECVHPDHLGLSLSFDLPNERRVVSHGYASERVKVRLVNPLTCKEVEPGTVGEIWFRSLTSECFYVGSEGRAIGFERLRVEDNGYEVLHHSNDYGFIHNDQLFILGNTNTLIFLPPHRVIFLRAIERRVEDKMKAVSDSVDDFTHRLGTPGACIHRFPTTPPVTAFSVQWPYTEVPHTVALATLPLGSPIYPQRQSSFDQLHQLISEEWMRQIGVGVLLMCESHKIEPERPDRLSVKRQYTRLELRTEFTKIAHHALIPAWEEVVPVEYLWCGSVRLVEMWHDRMLRRVRLGGRPQPTSSLAHSMEWEIPKRQLKEDIKREAKRVVQLPHPLDYEYVFARYWDQIEMITPYVMREYFRQLMGENRTSDGGDLRPAVGASGLDPEQITGFLLPGVLDKDPTEKGHEFYSRELTKSQWEAVFEGLTAIVGSNKLLLKLDKGKKTTPNTTAATTTSSTASSGLATHRGDRHPQATSSSGSPPSTEGTSVVFRLPVPMAIHRLILHQDIDLKPQVYETVHRPLTPQAFQAAIMTRNAIIALVNEKLTLVRRAVQHIQATTEANDHAARFLYTRWPQNLTLDYPFIPCEAHLLDWIVRQPERHHGGDGWKKFKLEYDATHNLPADKVFDRTMKVFDRAARHYPPKSNVPQQMLSRPVTCVEASSLTEDFFIERN